ncbi:MAG: AraC family transcriptional regulator [Clostridia bacterium]|nr:AraC family transcriptional regulator [Clostridia bacterium]
MIFDKYIFDEDDKMIMQLYHSTVKSGKRTYREHHHTQFEIAYFESGSGVYSVRGKEYEFMPGDIFVFSSDEVHCITDINDGEKLNIINLHFEPRFIWSENTGVADCELLRIFFDRNDNFQNRIDRNIPQTKKICEYILEIEKELKEKKLYYKQAVKMFLSYILIILIREYGYVGNTVEYKKDTLRFLEKSMHYIDENLENEISLDDVSKIASMNRTYFSTVFKKYNGISPWDYITIKRVERAVEYLKNSDATKTEIAGKCGFSSMSNFYRAFRQVTGKTPNDFIV